MRILLISTNLLKSPTPVVPVGAGIIYSSIKKHGYDAEFLDMAFLDNPLQKLKERLKSFQPDVICISIRNIDNHVMQKSESYLPFTKQVVSICRNNCSCKIIVGGAAMQVMPNEIMDYLQVDFGIIGPGEIEIISILRELDGTGTTCAKKENRLRIANNYFHPILSCIPEKDIFDNKYFNYCTNIKKTVIGYQTTRGCLNKCIYCSLSCQKRGFSRISNEQLDYDINMLTCKYGLKKVTFVDDIFNQDLDNTMNLCTQLQKISSNLKWTCSMTPAFFSEELIACMKIAGCVFVDLGIDSGSDKMLENMGKGFYAEKLIILADLLKKYQIPYSVSLLFGGPGENTKTIRETINIVNKLNPIYVLAGLGLRIYPKTKLYNIAIKEGIIKKDDNMLIPKFYSSSEFSIELLKNELTNSKHIYKDMLMNNL